MSPRSSHPNEKLLFWVLKTADFEISRIWTPSEPFDTLERCLSMREHSWYVLPSQFAKYSTIFGFGDSFPVIDVRICLQLFQKKSFPTDQTKSSKKNENCQNFDFSDFSFFLIDFEKNIFLKNSFFCCWKFWRKNLGHRYRSKISLRIEWEHSQPLKIVPEPL